MSGALASFERRRKTRQAAASCRRAGSWIAAVVALSLSSVAHAGPGVWTTGGPYGGWVQALAIDPTDPATLYAAVGGGAYKSTDSGGTWTAASTGLTGNVRTLAIDPTTSATVYAGTSAGGVFKSTDAGGTWTAANSGLTTLKVTCLAVDPANPATVYAGTEGGGIFKSTNAGGTWTAANVGLTNLYVFSLAVDPLHPTTLYAGMSNYGGVFKSTDSGDTWTAVGADLGTSVYALAIDPTTPTTIYAGTFYVGVYKSTDSGSTWNPANTGFTFPCDVTALVIDPVTPATLYAGTTRGGGVFKSTNSGSSWSAVNTGLASLYAGFLAIDPKTPTTLYTGTGVGLFKSVDAGGVWAAASTGVALLTVEALAVDPTNPSTLYTSAYTAGGVFRSIDSGSTWIPAGTGLGSLTVALAIDPATPATLYAGTVGGGVFKSTDSGGTWVAANTGLWDSTVYSLAIDPGTPTTVYAGTSRLVFKSTNAGGTWAEANEGLQATNGVMDLAIDPTTPATLYAATNGGGVFKSTDSGGTWNSANAGLPSATITLAIDPATPATLYAGTYSRGVFKSTDAGGTWSAVNAGLTSLQVNALAMTPAALYAGTYAGVFRTTNGGSTWMTVNNGLTNLNVEALAADSTGVTTVYAGLRYGSVWQSTPPTGATSDLALTLSDSPDPVTGMTPLTYTLGVANAGPDSATFVSVSHTLPAGVVFDGASGSGWTCSEGGGVVTCARPSLAVGTAPDIAVQVTPGPVSTVLVSSATVSAPQADPDTADNSDSETTTVNAPPVWMGNRTKAALADAGEFLINGAVTYTITLTNAGTGNQDDNPGHELVDTLPSSLTLVSADATSGTVVSDLAGNAVTWDGSLASGASVTITIHATIGPRVALGTRISNQATVSYDFDGDGTNEATAPSDDPSVGGDRDPTRFVVVSPPTSFFTLPPCRLIDTRKADGAYGSPALAAGADRVFSLSGRCGIPPTARALSVNVTVTQPSVAGNLRLYPAGTPLPQVSAINYAAGQTRANNAVVPLNGLGELAVRCAQASGTAHLVLDVNGYFEEANR